MATIDLVLPLYKPHPGWEKHIIDAITALRGEFAARNWQLHLYLVNDGSDLKFFPDESIEMIRRATNGDFDFISYSPNRGKGYCLRHGVALTHGDYQVYTDGDFPFGWESVVAAVEKLTQNANIVMGVRGREYGDALTWSRKVISSGTRKLNRLILGLPERLLDTQAGMKGFDAEGKRAFLATETNSFLFDTEFILLGKNAQMRIETVDLQLRSGLHFSRMGFKVVCRELRHFIRILFQVRICGKMKKR